MSCHHMLVDSSMRGLMLYLLPGLVTDPWHCRRQENTELDGTYKERLSNRNKISRDAVT